ncbi:hypothetical protein [Priestia flexa]|uniref:hypothetical protein n=1 Tax=Priestia flexa TaxID=86664 RepID=UPI003CFFB558
MISIDEKNKLQILLKYMEHQTLAEQYQKQLLKQQMLSPQIIQKSQQWDRNIDVSNRKRDVKGRFLPYDYPTEELKSTLGEEDKQRKIIVKPIEGSYNSYSVDEKEQRDWSGNLYLISFAIILTIAFLT